MKFKSCVATGLAVMLLVCQSGAAQQQHAAPVIAAPVSEHGELDVRQGDVDGDGVLDTVRLLGRTQDMRVSDLMLVVENGADGSKTTVALEDVGGYHAELQLADFTGTGALDCLVSVASGGSGGWMFHRVVSFAPRPAVIYADDSGAAALDGYFTNDYQVVFKDNDGNLIASADVSDRKSEYIRLGMYDDAGVLLVPTTVIISPFGKMTVVNTGQQAAGLKGWQRISGAYGADVLGNVETKLVYRNGAWQRQLLSLQLYLPSQLHLSLSEDGRSVRNQFTTRHAAVYYPQFDQLGDVVSKILVNSQLKDAAAILRDAGQAGADISVDYRVTRRDTGLLSVVFSGRQRLEGGWTPVMQAVNINLKTKEPLTAETMFKTDPASMAALSDLLKSAAEEAGVQTESPQFGTWIGVYLTDHSVVFYYLEHDTSLAYTTVPVALSKLRPYLLDGVL